jgi:type I restriction enzyme R subunit
MALSSGDKFGPYERRDAIRNLIAEEIPAKVAEDEANQNKQEHSDKQNARIEHDKARQRVVTDLLTDHTELFKQFSDNPWFRNRPSETNFTTTYV